MTLRMPEKLQARLRAYADYHCLPVNAVVRLALLNYLDYQETRLPRKPALQPVSASPPESEQLARARVPPPAGKHRVNDPCHCGSGRKYKRCHKGEDERREARL